MDRLPSILSTPSSRYALTLTIERKIQALCEDAWPCFTDSASKCCKTGFD